MVNSTLRKTTMNKSKQNLVKQNLVKQSLVGLILMLVCGFSFAATPKMGFVDMRAAIFTSDEAKIKLEKIKAELAHEEADMMSLRSGIQELEDRLKKDSAVMSADERRKVEKNIQDKMADFNFLGNKLKKSANDSQQELSRQMLPKLERAMKSVQEEQKLDIILNRDAALWISPEYDLTKAIVDKMNTLKN